MSANHLKVENPCPFLLSRMSKKNGSYFCSSCSKNIIDFRGKTEEEIKCATTKDTCGIFTSDQLKGQKRMSFWRQTAFYVFMFFSFLGFQVKPLSAQTPGINKTQQKIDNNEEPPKKKAKKEKKKVKKKKKPVTRFIGTPSF